jgi:hypothetical protein
LFTLSVIAGSCPSRKSKTPAFSEGLTKIKNIAAMDTTLGTFVEKRDPALTVLESESAESVLGRLALYDITSLPVVATSGSVVGVVSVLDILGYVSYQALDNVDLSIPVGDLLRTSRENQEGGVYLFEATEPMSALLKPFSLAVHRVLVRMPNQHFGTTSSNSR